MNNTTDRWWQRPQAFLYAWDFSRDCGRFLPLERGTLKASAFLDQRIPADRSALRDAAIEDLLAEPVTGTIPDPGLIFHTAFCCSTLFARSLDLPGRSLVLREPLALLQLADLQRGLTMFRRKPETMLSLTLDFLARSFLPSERVVIKPTNLANNLAPDMLRSRPQAKALVLYDELEPFLLSVLKRPKESHDGIPRFLTRLLVDDDEFQKAFPNMATMSLTEQAALAWTLQIRSLNRWLASETPGRVRVLPASELLAAPATALTAAARWFELNLDETEASRIAAGPLWSRHAKDERFAYSPAQRGAEQKLARRLLALPVREGFCFARERFGIDRADFSPNFRLLN